MPIAPVAASAQTMFADLIQLSLDANFVEDFLEQGNFVKVTVKARAYWYFDAYRRGAPDAAKRRTRRYVGPVGDPEIDRRVAAFREMKPNLAQRRRLVSALRAAGLPAPDAYAGGLVDTLGKAGLFRLRSVLVGTTAFQAYAGLLGVRLPGAVVTTQDVDVAQFHSIAVSVDDELPPIMETLRAFDPSFRAVPHLSDPIRSTAFRNSRGFRLEFLTPNRGPDDFADRPAPMPALGGAGAQALRFLDFLIREPVRSVLLFGAGVPVAVPAPARYAIHKLMVAVERRGGADNAKIPKDIAQAGTLVEALAHARQAIDLGFAWMEAHDRGEGWRRRLAEGRLRLPDGPRAILDRAIGDAAGLEKRSPAAYGAD